MTFPNIAPPGTPASAPGNGASVPVWGHGGNMPQGDPNQPHPTVGNLGMPGAPGTTVLPPNNQPPMGHPTLPGNLPPMNPQPGTFATAPNQWGPGTNFGQPGAPQPPMGQPAPAPVQGWGNPGGQPMGQPTGAPAPMQPPMQQPGGRVSLTDDVILDGPGVPAEFRGRTFGQVKQVYQALATDWMQRNPNAVPSGNMGRPPQGQPAPAQQPNMQPAAGQPGDEDTAFWSNPAGFVRRAIGEAMQPMTAQTMATQIAEARRIATTGVNDYGVIEGEVMGIVSQTDESLRTNPQVWVNAIDLARGRMLRDGRYQQEAQRLRSTPQPNGQPGGQPNGGQPTWGNPNMPPAPNGGPGSAVPATMVPVYGFFTEQPNGPTMPRAGLTPEQQFYARKFNMSDEDYIAWASVQSNMTPRQNGQGGWQ